MRPTTNSAYHALHIALLATLAITIPDPSHASGCLWLGAEYAGQGTICRQTATGGEAITRSAMLAR